MDYCTCNVGVRYHSYTDLQCSPMWQLVAIMGCPVFNSVWILSTIFFLSPSLLYSCLCFEERSESQYLSVRFNHCPYNCFMSAWNLSSNDESTVLSLNQRSPILQIVKCQSNVVVLGNELFKNWGVWGRRHYTASKPYDLLYNEIKGWGQYRSLEPFKQWQILLFLYECFRIFIILKTTDDWTYTIKYWLKIHFNDRLTKYSFVFWLAAYVYRLTCQKHVLIPQIACVA